MSLHPAVAVVRRAVRRGLDEVEPGSTVVVACSGGADSLALLSATVFEGKRARDNAGLRVIGVTIDHGLQAGSGAHADHVVAQMVGLGVDETVSARVQVEGGGIGPEAAARRARYAVLEEIGSRFEATVVLLGHTRDDQAETVLLGLARGSGGRSLAGMRRSFDRYRRPLLDVGRDDTVTACQVEGIEFWTDPHNADPRFTRSRVRTRLLPALEDELGPGVAETLARTADQLREDMDFLDQLADAEMARLADVDPDRSGRSGRSGGSLAAAELAGLPTPLRRRVLRLAALAAGAPAAELFHEHVLGLEALVTDWHGQKWVELPGGVRGVRRDGRLTIERAR